MPIVATSTYNTGTEILNTARAMVNDAYVSLSGELLVDTNPQTLEYLNTAWRYLQEKLAMGGFTALQKEIILPNLTPTTVIDPSTQVSIGFNGYFDGAQNNQNPALPGDLLEPLRLFERDASSGQSFYEMRQVQESLPSVIPGSFFGVWDWRGDAIWMTGRTSPADLRLFYAAYYADLTATTATVPILRCRDALAAYVAAEYSGARESARAESFTDKGDAFVDLILTRTARRQQRINFRRRSYRRRV